MLRIPSLRKIGDLTVFQDDAVWTRFYLMPSVPTIRRDEQGRPIFLLTVFHRSDQAREDGGSDGGGFMNFDTQFAVEKSARDAAMLELQTWVNEEYARRRTHPQYAGQPEYASGEAPPIEFADPLLSGGTVSMHTTQSTQLVTGRFAEAPASLVSDSTAVFNVDLTEDGASFMKQLFLTETGGGRIDLTPVQVIYNLKMWARLPPVLITVTGDSERIHTTMQKLSETTRDNVCTLSEIENYRETGSNCATLKESGLVTVKIDKGDANVSEEALQELQLFALELFDTMIKEKFLIKADGSDEPFDFSDSAPPLRPGAIPRSSRMRVRPPGNSRYKVRQTVDHSTMHLEIKVDRSQVVEWPTGGQATLATFFAGASAEELKRHVVDLTANDFDSLGVTVRAIVDFETQPAQAVEVQTEYTAKDSQGQTRTTHGAFTFRAGEMAPAKFDPTVLGNRREYRFRTRTIFDDGTTTDFTPWETSTSRALNVTVADAGGLGLEISGASLNWDVIRGVKVALAHSDPADPSRRAQKTFELTKLNPIRKWEQRFNRQASGTIQASLTYFLADDKVVEVGEPSSIALSDSLFIVPPPQVDVLNVTLMPSGDWSEVAQVVVLLKYDAGEGRVYDKTFRLTSLEQLAEWAVLLRDPERRKFQYQTLVSYKGGTDEQSPWVTREGDQVISIQVKGVPKLRVNVLSNLVSFERTPLVKITLSYGEERTTLSFIAPGATAWEVPLAADGRRDYAYEITWHPVNGAPISSGLQRSDETQLFIPRPPVSAGNLTLIVRGFANWDVTPFVDVAVEWGDGVNQHALVTLMREQIQQRQEIPDVTQRRFRYAVTYNLADGTRVTGAKGETTDTVIVVPALKQ